MLLRGKPEFRGPLSLTALFDSPSLLTKQVTVLVRALPSGPPALTLSLPAAPPDHSWAPGNGRQAQKWSFPRGTPDGKRNAWSHFPSSCEGLPLHRGYCILSALPVTSLGILCPKYFLDIHSCLSSSPVTNSHLGNLVLISWCKQQFAPLAPPTC